MPPQSGPAPRSDRDPESVREEAAAEETASEVATQERESEFARNPADRARPEPAVPVQSADRAATPPTPSTSSQAFGDHALHDDPLADAFFRHPDKPVIDVWEEHPPVVHTMSRGSRRAMFASIGIFVVSALSIGVYSVYQNWIMPVPAELGAGRGDMAAMLPTPIDSPPPAAADPVPETQLAAATDPAPPTSPAHVDGTLAANADLEPVVEPAPPTSPAHVDGTLAAVAARQPLADPTGAEPKSEGAAAEHLRAAADESARVAERLRDPANLRLSGSLGGSGDPAPPQEAPVRAFGRTAGAPTYEELVEVGRALSKRNRRVEASEAFRRALLKSPQGSAALSGLSYVYLNAEENQTARAYAERAVQSDATNAEGWIVLGAALEMLGDRAGAQDAYRNCVQHGQGPYLLECRRVLR